MPSHVGKESHSHLHPFQPVITQWAHPRRSRWAATAVAQTLTHTQNFPMSHVRPQAAPLKGTYTDTTIHTIVYISHLHSVFKCVNMCFKCVEGVKLQIKNTIKCLSISQILTSAVGLQVLLAWIVVHFCFLVVIAVTISQFKGLNI